MKPVLNIHAHTQAYGDVNKHPCRPCIWNDRIFIYFKTTFNIRFLLMPNCKFLLENFVTKILVRFAATHMKSLCVFVSIMYKDVLLLLRIKYLHMYTQLYTGFSSCLISLSLSLNCSDFFFCSHFKL